MIRKLVVGIGNYEKKYSLTRHNMGFLFLSSFAMDMSWKFKKDENLLGSTTFGTVKGVNLHLLMPLTYVNNSGDSVKLCFDKYNYKPSDIVIVVDDIAIPFGVLRFRLNGSSGGHNGLVSIENAIDSTDYPRLRLGIGKNDSVSVEEHVLSNFKEEELNSMPQIFDCAKKVLYYWLCGFVDQAISCAGNFNLKEVE